MWNVFFFSLIHDLGILISGNHKKRDILVTIFLVLYKLAPEKCTLILCKVQCRAVVTIPILPTGQRWIQGIVFVTSLSPFLSHYLFIYFHSLIPVQCNLGLQSWHHCICFCWLLSSLQENNTYSFIFKKNFEY